MPTIIQTNSQHKNNTSINNENQISPNQKKTVLNISPILTVKFNQETDYFVAGSDMKTDRAASSKTTLKYTMNLVMCSQELDASKAISPLNITDNVKS